MSARSGIADLRGSPIIGDITFWKHSNFLKFNYAFAVRFLGINYGLPYLHHWDEPQIASTAITMLKTGDYNPHDFIYPALTTISRVY